MRRLSAGLVTVAVMTCAATAGAASEAEPASKVRVEIEAITVYSDGLKADLVLENKGQKEMIVGPWQLAGCVRGCSLKDRNGVKWMITPIVSVRHVNPAANDPNAVRLEVGKKTRVTATITLGPWLIPIPSKRKSAEDNPKRLDYKIKANTLFRVTTKEIVTAVELRGKGTTKVAWRQDLGINEKEK